MMIYKKQSCDSWQTLVQLQLPSTSELFSYYRQLFQFMIFWPSSAIIHLTTAMKIRFV